MCRENDRVLIVGTCHAGMSSLFCFLFPVYNIKAEKRTAYNQHPHITLRSTASKELHII